jgi:hypothetical protein
MQVGQTERAKEALSKAVELNPSQAQYKQVLDGL